MVAPIGEARGRRSQNHPRSYWAVTFKYDEADTPQRYGSHGFETVILTEHPVIELLRRTAAFPQHQYAIVWSCQLKNQDMSPAMFGAIKDAVENNFGELVPVTTDE